MLPDASLSQSFCTVSQFCTWIDLFYTSFLNQNGPDQPSNHLTPTVAHMGTTIKHPVCQTGLSRHV